MQTIKQSMNKVVIKIDVISDVVCPWCYIGKRRLEKAMDQLVSEYDFEIEYHPFELNPFLPSKGVNQKEYLAEKFGGMEQYDLITGRTAAIALQEGLVFNFSRQAVSPNTRKAHALIQLAKEEGKQGEMVETFFKAYFTDGIDLSNDENLISLAVNVGLDSDRVQTILLDKETLKNLEEREQELQTLGIRAVPFYIIDNQYGISGAQTSATFVKALKEAGEKIEVTGEACDADGTNC